MNFMFDNISNNISRVRYVTKVTYGKYATRVPDEVAYGIYEWFSSQ